LSDITWLTAAELSAAYAAGTLSPVEAARAVLARIESANPAVNAFCHLDPKTTLAQAAESEVRWKQGAPRSPVDGVPTSIKDLMWVKGWPCRYGSLAESDKPVPDDDPAVAFLRGAGCVLLGKTTTPEYGNSGVTDSPLTGLTKNPWALTHTPGGSSGGAVAAVAAGCGPLALGSDGGGSIRTPASFTNLVGHKPTFDLSSGIMRTSFVYTLSGVIGKGPAAGLDDDTVFVQPNPVALNYLVGTLIRWWNSDSLLSRLGGIVSQICLTGHLEKIDIAIR